MSEARQKQRIPDEAFRHMQRLFIERTHPLFLRFDREMKLEDWWGDSDYYGFDPLSVGDDAGSKVDFLVGVTAEDALELPIVQTPNGQPVSIHVRPEESGLCVLILDARSEHDRQTEIQQKSNEVQLLSKKQQMLMEELKATQIEVDRKRREAEAANRLKSEFISSMSHEFRTPLTSVLGYTEILENTLRNERSQLDKLGAISRGAKHLLSLIENLLDHGRLEDGAIVMQIRPTEMDLLVDDLRAIFTPLAEQKDLAFEIETQGLPSQRILIDDMRYRQILINLVGNAVKFTQSGSVHLKLTWEDGRIRSQVSDTGPGIPDAAHERVFLAFQRVNEDSEAGAGLGLAISQRIVQIMGGQLELESSDASGSRFGFTIDAPITSDDGVGQDTAITQLRPVSDSATGHTVLLAEDDDDIAQLIEIVLDDADYKLVRARNGREAVDLALLEKPDLMLMDMNMPVVNGIEAVRELRSNGFTQPVIALTASASASYRASAIEAGCNDYLVKPVDLATLLTTIADAIAHSS